MIMNFADKFTNKFRSKQSKEKEGDNCTDENSKIENDSQEDIEGVENNEIVKLTNEKIAIEEKLAKVLYALAESEDYKKRLLNSIELEGDKVLQKFTKAISAPFDDLLRVLNREKNEALQMIFNKLLKALGDNKIEIVQPCVGDEFDPEIHNAISTIPNPDIESGKIADVLSFCYKANGKVVVTSMVVLSA